nr:T9SS sorting signal type C domain-containing protein [uncultured Flavobacterium sp.]
MKQKLLNAIFFLKLDYWEFPNFNIRHTGKGVNIKLLFLFLSFLIGSSIVNAQSARLYSATSPTICSGKSVNLKIQITGTQYASYTVKYIYTDLENNKTETILNDFKTTDVEAVGGSGEYKLTSVISNSNVTIPLHPDKVIVVVKPAPVKPNIQTVVQPSCLVNRGSITLSDLPASGNWTIQPGGITGAGTSRVISNLNPGNYSFTVTHNGCISESSNIVTINAPATVTPAPVLTNNITLGCNQTSYLLEWPAVAIATGYKLDVATDMGFNNFLSGYQDKELSNVTSETITGLAANTVYYVRLRAISDCGTSLNSNIINVNPMQSTTYYDGSWSNGAPDSSKNVIFNSSFNIKTNTNACTCQVNAGANVTVDSGVDLKIENGLTVDPAGTLTFENNASLIQINDVKNSGNVTYKRTTSPMKNFDYTYWSSPVSGQRLYDLSPNTLADKYLSYGLNGWITHMNGDSVMQQGIGYGIRVPKPHFWPNPSDLTYIQPVEFVGIPNNGGIDGETVPGNKYHLVGNPYPSALDADQFLEENKKVLYGTLYFWTHNTAIKPSGHQFVYTSDDYAAYNGVGGVATRPALSSGINESEPTGKIAAGQSFMIASLAPGTITFNNSMRVLGNNGQFFKQTRNNKIAVQKDRFWLNLTNKEGAFKQILIGYVPGATNNYDGRFDGSVFSGNSFINFYSKTQTSNLVIQGRALPLEDTDSIQLGYNSTIDGVFSIEIGKVDGQFFNKAIYLEDKKTNTYFNLKNGGYEFSTLKGTFDDRFVIHYVPNVIQTPVLADVPELNCSQTSFVVNWDAIENASSYRYDIATDQDFINILPDYQDREVSGYNSEEIAGLTGTRYYIRLRAMYNSVASTNSNVIAVSAPITVYNGEWSNGLPDSNKNIIFDNVNYILPGDVSACSCQINGTAKVTVPDGATLKLENGLSVKENGSLTFENNASLVQINDVVNTGNIIYKRISAPMKTADYTYWSSPVAEQKLDILSPNTLSNRYFSLYNNNWVSEQVTASMTPAKGYIIGAPKSGTWPNGETVRFPYAQPVQFIGVPNNGHFEFTILNNGSKNLIGNPYPSAVDADAFLDANSNVLGGTIYFWKNNTSPKFLKYLLDDYACYNALGGVAAAAAGEASGGTNSIKPTGKIAAGQSFITESIVSGTVVFDNNMRLEGENLHFLKLGKTAKTASIEKHRFWLNLTNSLGAFEQILIGYADGATNNYDNRFDARDWSGNSYTSFYSVNQNDKLTIQGRALPFDNADVVTLGYRSLLGGYFTIALDSADGLFANHPIYLEDKKLKVFHNLQDGAYNFVSFLGTHDNRFVIHYGVKKTSKTAKNNTSDSIQSANEVIVSPENNQISINSFEEIIDKVFVYDLNGKQIYEKGHVNTNEFYTPILVFSNQVLVVKVILQNGKTVIKKAVF